LIQDRDGITRGGRRLHLKATKDVHVLDDRKGAAVLGLAQT